MHCTYMHCTYLHFYIIHIHLHINLFALLLCLSSLQVKEINLFSYGLQTFPSLLFMV